MKSKVYWKCPEIILCEYGGEGQLPSSPDGDTGPLLAILSQLDQIVQCYCPRLQLCFALLCLGPLWPHPMVFTDHVVPGLNSGLVYFADLSPLSSAPKGLCIKTSMILNLFLVDRVGERRGIDHTQQSSELVPGSVLWGLCLELWRPYGVPGIEHGSTGWPSAGQAIHLLRTQPRILTLSHFFWRKK